MSLGRIPIVALVCAVSLVASIAAADNAAPAKNVATADLEATISAQDELQARELAYLKHQLDSLRVVVARLLESARNSQASDSLMACVSDELATLRFENEYLRALTQAALAQYASTDDDEVAKPHLAALSRALADLNDSLAGIADHQAPAQPSAEQPGGIEYCGWIDVSNSTEYGTNQSNFNLDQVELDVTTAVTGRGSVRADLEYVSNYDGNFSLNLEQAYFTYTADAANRWTLAFGKFNSPTGWEVADPDGLYLYSYSLVYTYGLPTNLTGAMAAWSPSSSVRSRVLVTNGWDVDADNNKDKTIGARLDLTPVSSFNAGFSALYGPEQDGSVASKRSVYDLALTWSPSERITFGGDLVSGSETHLLADDGTASWHGAMLLSQLSLTSRVILFSRFDYFNDKDGVRTGTPQEWKAVAISPNLQVSDAFGAGVELRYNWSNQATYPTSSGALKRHQISTALQFTYGI